MNDFAAHLRRPMRVAAIAVCITLAPMQAQPIEFRIDEGRNINAFVREGRVAAHVLLRSGTDPRLIVAFPAGNSGVGVWFAKTQRPATWTLTKPPRPITLTDEKGRPLHGIETEAVVDIAELAIEQAALSSIRVLRDYETLRTAPQQILTSPRIENGRIVWARERLDGAAGYRLSIAPLDGATVTPTAVKAGPSGRVHIAIQALTGETPLTPRDEAALLTRGAQEDKRTRNALVFLSYEEKYLAGSWRFNTYFGRDTLMSLALLAPALQAPAFESGISSVLTRLAPNGEVAHEEDIGEFAVLRNASEGRGASAAPIYDYGMIDDDFMLAPVAARWLLDSTAGRERAAKFLGAKAASGELHGAALVRNLRWLVDRTRAFADDPQAVNLVGIKEGRMTGQWRDSEEGLGRGRFAYDVNVVFVPAALDAADRLLASGLLDRYLSPDQRRILERARAQHRAWSSRAAPLFVVTLPAARAGEQVRAYATQVGVDAAAALAAVDRNGNTFAFDAISLDAAGRHVPVMHSDGGFAMLFGSPSAADLDRMLAMFTQPFPAGLYTPIGVLVANPALADRTMWPRFDNTAYHGTVVWSWQQAVLAAGLDRQIAREDLDASLRSKLLEARKQLWSAIDAADAVRTSELWSWSFANGRYRVEPFGARGTHVDESNAAQLWSTVFLALPRPAPLAPALVRDSLTR